MNLIDRAFEKAKETLHMNVTDMGFTACSTVCDRDPNSNYNSIWTRDASMTLMWLLDLGDSELNECGRQSLETILSRQTRDGHLPNYVSVGTGQARYGGIGNIAGIDGPMWLIIAAKNYVKVSGDYEFARKHYNAIHKSMKWLRSHDSNNCGLLEIPEASDWADIFPRSYNVLYDEVLWYRANLDFVELRKLSGHPAERYIERSEQIRKLINDQFWPTPETLQENMESFANVHFSLGRTRYLITQITPFGFNWRCDVFANIIAFLQGVIDHERAEQICVFLQQICIDQPYPVKVLYPAIHPGSADWRDYFLVNLLNLPDHYHNGGIWPFVGGLWVRFLLKLGQRQNAEKALEKLALLCKDGISSEWEFNEWAHGQTGKPMGKAHQAWSAASYVAAYLNFQDNTVV